MCALGLVSSELGSRGMYCRSKKGIGLKVSLLPLVSTQSSLEITLSALAFCMKILTIVKVIYGC